MTVIAGTDEVAPVVRGNPRGPRRVNPRPPADSEVPRERVGILVEDPAVEMSAPELLHKKGKFFLDSGSAASLIKLGILDKN